MKLCTLCGCLALLLSACALAPQPLAVQPLLKDGLFQPQPPPIRADAVLALTPAMQRYADTELRPAMQSGTPEQALMDALYSKGHLQLEYDAGITRSAAQAFEARTGNCLSLVMMTAAFARYLGLPVRFQAVHVEQSWSRSEQILMASGHVNLSLSNYSDDGNSFHVGNHTLTVDFLPSSQAARYRTRVISEATVVAMYMNNRAAEELVAGHLDAAYGWIKAALDTAPAYLESLNTLAVIYHQHGNAVEAEAALRQVLTFTPDNTIAMSNLVGVLHTLGRHEEATQMAARLAQIEPYPAYYFYDLGVAALKARQYLTARDYFQRELRREHALPEAHFGLAVAAMGLGDPARAERYLKAAIDNSTTVDTRALYSAKLDWLREQGYERNGRRAGS